MPGSLAPPTATSLTVTPMTATPMTATSARTPLSGPIADLSLEG
jgi:hypothetical protein